MSFAKSETPELISAMLGAILRREREAAGRTLADVAEAAGLSPAYLSEVERGRKEISTERLITVARTLRISVAAIYRELASGLDGADPAAGVETARIAWEAGDLDATLAAAADAVALLAAAPERGRTRAIVYGGGATAVLLLVLLAVIVLARRRGAAGRRARAAALASVAQVPFPGAESDPDAGWPYATLRPNGPPAEPPGGPPSGDEGADRS